MDCVDEESWMYGKRGEGIGKVKREAGKAQGHDLITHDYDSVINCVVPFALWMWIGFSFPLLLARVLKQYRKFQRKKWK